MALLRPQWSELVMAEPFKWLNTTQLFSHSLLSQWDWGEIGEKKAGLSQSLGSVQYLLAADIIIGVLPTLFFS